MSTVSKTRRAATSDLPPAQVVPQVAGLRLDHGCPVQKRLDVGATADVPGLREIAHSPTAAVAAPT